MTLKGESGEVVISTRVTPEIEERYEQLAAYHGRSKSSEVRWALILFDTLATLDYLHSDDAKGELSAAELRKARENVKSALHDFAGQAFGRPQPLHLYPKAG